MTTVAVPSANFQQTPAKRRLLRSQAWRKLASGFSIRTVNHLMRDDSPRLNSSRWAQEMPLVEVDDYFRLVIARFHIPGRPSVAPEQATDLIRRAGLTEQQVFNIFDTFVSMRERDIRKGRIVGPDQFTVAMGHLLWNQIDSPALAGSISRYLRACEVEDGYINTTLLFSASTPLAVVARLLSSFPGDEGGSSWSVEHLPDEFQEKFRKDVVDAYPELAGLPVGMLPDLVAMHPVPEDWHVNLWTLPKQ